MLLQVFEEKKLSCLEQGQLLMIATAAQGFLVDLVTLDVGGQSLQLSWILTSSQLTSVQPEWATDGFIKYFQVAWKG
jgi:hypothetical protein